MSKIIHVKLVFIGDNKAGKTALSEKILRDKFTAEYNKSLTIEYDSAFTNLSDIAADPEFSDLGPIGLVALQIWNTHNQSKDDGLLCPLYEGAHAIVLCIDLTNRKSLNSIKFWLDQARAYGDKNIPIKLVGTKADLVTNRTISNIDLEKVAKQYNLIFEPTTDLTSAKTNKNITEFFLHTLSIAADNEVTHQNSFWQRHKNAIDIIITVGFFISFIGAILAAIFTPFLAPLVLPLLGLSLIPSIAGTTVIMVSIGIIVSPIIAATIATLVIGIKSIIACFTVNKDYRQLDDNNIELETFSSYAETLPRLAKQANKNDLLITAATPTSVIGDIELDDLSRTDTQTQEVEEKTETAPQQDRGASLII